MTLHWILLHPTIAAMAQSVANSRSDVYSNAPPPVPTTVLPGEAIPLSSNQEQMLLVRVFSP